MDHSIFPQSCVSNLDLPLQINETKFSPDGSKFLVLPATFQPRIYDRDGEEVSVMFFILGDAFHYLTRATFIKGDPYIRDMKNTA